MSLVAERKNDVRSVAEYGQCKSQHHEESKPEAIRSVLLDKFNAHRKTYLHGSMQSPSDLIILLQPWTTP